MTDLFGFELGDGLASDRCPLCHALDVHMQRWLDSFWREGRRQPVVRERFYAAGGFCNRHVWLARPDRAHPNGVADVYGRLASRDIAAADAALAKRARRRERVQCLRRPAPCPACREEEDAAIRKAQFLLDMMATPTGRERYEKSRGACHSHLLVMLGEADDPLSRFLLEDWRRRLVGLRDRAEDDGGELIARYAGRVT